MHVVNLLRKRRLLDIKMEENQNPSEFSNKFKKLINDLNNARESVSNEVNYNIYYYHYQKYCRIVDIVVKYKIETDVDISTKVK